MMRRWGSGDGFRWDFVSCWEGERISLVEGMADGQVDFADLVESVERGMAATSLPGSASAGERHRCSVHGLCHTQVLDDNEALAFDVRRVFTINGGFDLVFSEAGLTNHDGAPQPASPAAFPTCMAPSWAGGRVEPADMFSIITLYWKNHAARGPIPAPYEYPFPAEHMSCRIEKEQNRPCSIWTVLCLSVGKGPESTLERIDSASRESPSPP